MKKILLIITLIAPTMQMTAMTMTPEQKAALSKLINYNSTNNSKVPARLYYDTITGNVVILAPVINSDGIPMEIDPRYRPYDLQ